MCCGNEDECKDQRLQGGSSEHETGRKKRKGKMRKNEGPFSKNGKTGAKGGRTMADPAIRRRKSLDGEGGGGNEPSDKTGNQQYDIQLSARG